MSGIWRGQVRLSGDGADEGGRAAGQNPQAEVFLWERGQCCALYYYQDCWLPPLPRGEIVCVLCDIQISQSKVMHLHYCVLTGGTQRPKTQQHPLHGRLWESRLYKNLWLWVCQAASGWQWAAPHTLLHCQLCGTRGKRREEVSFFRAWTGNI